MYTSDKASKSCTSDYGAQVTIMASDCVHGNHIIITCNYKIDVVAASDDSILIQARFHLAY